MGVRVVRIAAIIGVGIGTFWLGETFGPRRAQAEVYRVLEFQVSSLARALEREVRPGSERLIVLNGNLLHCKLGSTRLLPAELLDRMEVLAHRSEAQFDASADPEWNPVDVEVSKILRRPFRVEGEGWGAFGQLAGGRLDDFTPLLPELAKTGKFGPAGANGFLALAFGSRRSALTDVWMIRFDEDFNWRSLLRESAADVPGGDIPGLPRFADSRRVLTLSEFSDVGDSHVVGYEGSGSIRSHVHHYERILRAIELRPVQESSILGDEALIQFGSEDRDVTVFVSRTESGKTLDLVQVKTSEEDG